VYQMTYTNSFEEDRYLSTLQREAEAFKKLIEDRMVSTSTTVGPYIHGVAEYGHPDLQ